jgi:hypothetical protein
MSFGGGFSISPLSGSSILNFTQDVTAIAQGVSGGAVGSISSSYIIHVNGGSAQTPADGTISKPFTTVQAALDHASSSYTNFNESVMINIAPGTYSENITVRRHNIYLRSDLDRSEQRGAKILGTTNISCSATPSNGKYNHVVGFEGLFLSSDASTVTASVNILSPGSYTTYFKNCYLYTTKTGVSALRTSGSISGSADGKKIILKDSHFNTTSTAGYAGNILDVRGGDLKIDTVEIYTTSPGSTAVGLNIAGDSLVLADRLLTNISSTGYGVNNNSTLYSTSLYSLTLSNTSITSYGTVSINTNNGTYLNDIILATAANGGIPVISGTIPSSVYYTDLSSPIGSYPVLSSSIGVPVYTGFGHLNATQITGSDVKVTTNLRIVSGSNKPAGTVQLNGANPATASVTNNLVTTNSLIFLTVQSASNGNGGNVFVKSKNNGSFIIQSGHNNTDSSIVGYLIVNQ